MSYPVTKSFLSTNGSEPLWYAMEKYYDTSGRMGSNCYSFAMDDFRKEGQREHKAVPGDLTMYVNTNSSLTKTPQLVQFRKDLRQRPLNPSTKWRTCADPVYRVLMDGRAASILHRQAGVSLRHDRVIKLLSKNPMKVLGKRVPDGWRKVVMVVDGEHPGNDTTDFHFFAQCRLPLWDLYNVPLVTMIKEGRTVDMDTVRNNVYMAAGINAFSSRQDILQRHLQNHRGLLSKRIIDDLLAPHARALTNLRIHLRRVPDCALWFVPRPFWILDVDPHAAAHPRKEVHASYNRLMRVMREEKNRRGMYVLQIAYSRARRVLRKSKTTHDELPLHTDIGMWAEKAGWASEAMNADGSGKLIFDPHYADRDHGAYDYDTVCAVFQVLSGYGMTSVPLV